MPTDLQAKLVHTTAIACMFEQTTRVVTLATLPDATITLEVLVVLVAAGLAVSLATSSSAVRDVVLKAGGGALLVLGSYYAARTLKENRADKRVDQMLKATELTADSSDAVSGGAAHVVLLLAEDIVESSGNRKTERLEAIKFVLDSMHRKSPSSPRLDRRDQDSAK